MNTPPAAGGAARLDHWGVIRAQGDDAASFLHGQLTNGVTSLDGRSARLAGYCSAKGRLLASFIVWRAADGSVLLACHASLLAATLKRLAMFVMRAKCTLVDASAELPLWGLAAAGAQAACPGLAVWGQVETEDGATVIRLPDGDGMARALRIGSAPPVESESAMPAISATTWAWLEVASGLPTIEAATADRFVPQMLNFELVGGVDFAKGCYPGQEVVARSQYRGTVKRRMFRFDCDAPVAPGQEVFDAADPSQPAGMVCNAASWPGEELGNGKQRWSLLAEVKLAAQAAGHLHLGAADGPVLTAAALPYALPSLDDAAA